MRKCKTKYNSNGQKLDELKSEYQVILEKLDRLEQQEVIGAFDKRTIIELSNDVIQEIAQKYDNVQKGVGDIMGGALIETEARTILYQGINQGLSQGFSEAKKQTALKLLKRGKLTIEEIAEDTGLSVAEVEALRALDNITHGMEIVVIVQGNSWLFNKTGGYSGTVPPSLNFSFGYWLKTISQNPFILLYPQQPADIPLSHLSQQMLQCRHSVQYSQP